MTLEQRIIEIRHLYTLATEGDWYAENNSSYWEIRVENFGQIGDMCASNYETGLEDTPNLARGEANSKLTAAAHNIVPLLLQELDELTIKLRRYKEFVDNAALADMIQNGKDLGLIRESFKVADLMSPAPLGFLPPANSSRLSEMYFTPQRTTLGPGSTPARNMDYEEESKNGNFPEKP